MFYKKTLLTAGVLALIVSAQSSMAQETLTGDVALACEAILCLSSPANPSECAPSLARYFGINMKKWNDTVTARTNFLNQCPVASSDANMRSLDSAIAQGAGRCDAASLNSSLVTTVPVGEDGWRQQISNQMPGYCQAYMSNPYTNFKSGMPVYVGTPETGGYWTTAGN